MRIGVGILVVLGFALQASADEADDARQATSLLTRLAVEGRTREAQLDPLILPILRSPYASVRLLAVEFLRRHPEVRLERFAERLSPLLADPDERVRTSAWRLSGDRAVVPAPIAETLSAVKRGTPPFVPGHVMLDNFLSVSPPGLPEIAALRSGDPATIALAVRFVLEGANRFEHALRWDTLWDALTEALQRVITRDHAPADFILAAGRVLEGPSTERTERLVRHLIAVGRLTSDPAIAVRVFSLLAAQRPESPLVGEIAARILAHPQWAGDYDRFALWNGIANLQASSVWLDATLRTGARREGPDSREARMLERLAVWEPGAPGTGPSSLETVLSESRVASLAIRREAARVLYSRYAHINVARRRLREMLGPEEIPQRAAQYAGLRPVQSALAVMAERAFVQELADWILHDPIAPPGLREAVMEAMAEGRVVVVPSTRTCAERLGAIGS